MLELDKSIPFGLTRTELLSCPQDLTIKSLDKV